MTSVQTCLREALTDIKGEDFSACSLDADLMDKCGVDSIDLVELFFRAEQSLKVEMEISDLKNFCRERHGGDLKILLGDMVDYIATLQK